MLPLSQSLPVRIRLGPVISPGLERRREAARSLLRFQRSVRGRVRKFYRLLRDERGSLENKTFLGFHVRRTDKLTKPLVRAAEGASSQGRPYEQT